MTHAQVKQTLSLRQDASEYRVVVFGNAAVGKTSLITRFLNGSFKDHYNPTVEDTYRKVIVSDTVLCTLIITDTGGSHSFPAMERLAVQRGHAFILVYSIADKQSFEDLQRYYDLILSVKGSMDRVPLVLVGNKYDTKNRVVSENEGMKQAKLWKTLCVETSAQQALHIKDVFEHLARLEQTRMISFDTKSNSHNKVGRRLSLNLKRETLKKKCSIM